jgi:hypothetical protein
MFPRDMVCFRNGSVDTLHKGDTEDNNNNNNNNAKWSILLPVTRQMKRFLRMRNTAYRFHVIAVFTYRIVWITTNCRFLSRMYVIFPALCQ